VKVCERCGATALGEFTLLDYCAECSRDLCPSCMAQGCCGHVPALSGEAAVDDALALKPPIERTDAVSEVDPHPRAATAPAPPAGRDPAGGAPPGHVPKKITEIFAWICVEPDGGDGIPAIEAPWDRSMMLPLIGSDRERIESLRPWAEDVARRMGLPVRLVRFSCAEELEQL
jgi:hypothetical protein